MRKIPRTFRIPSWYVPTGMVLIYARLSKLITHAPPEPSSPCFFLLAGAVASVLYVCEYVVRSNNNNKLDDTSRTHFDDDNSIKLATFAAIAHFMYARNDDNDGNVVWHLSSAAAVPDPISFDLNIDTWHTTLLEH